MSDSAKTLLVLYRNYRGEVSWREIIPSGLRWGHNQWPPSPQYLLECEDAIKGDRRTFALADILHISRVPLSAEQRGVLKESILEAIHGRSEGLPLQPEIIEDLRGWDMTEGREL